MRRRWIFIGPAAILGIAAFMALGGWIVMSLWNWLLPLLFGWRVITFWQALGMLVLCRLLFGGWGMGRGSRSHRGRRMAERWEQMTPEERDRLRQGLRGRCGYPEEPSGSAPSPGVQL